MKITITFIITGLIALGEIASQFQLRGCRNGVQTRKNINSLSQDELNRYFNAIKKLNSGGSGFWAKMTRDHVRYKDFIHSNQDGEGRDVFLIWHRTFLREMEVKLQEIDPSITIPYWDWSHKQINERNKVFSNALFGGPGEQRNRQCVANGSFRNFKVYATATLSNTNQCLSRSSFRNVQTVSDDVIASGFLTKKTIREFKRIEMAPHAYPHNSVGGMMGSHGSPADPLFWSHHAFIDKLWYDWQRINPGLAQEYGMRHSAPIRFGYDNIKIGDAVIAEKLCYRYPQEHFMWTNRPLRNSVRLSRSHTNPKVEPYSAPKGLNQEELEKFDREYVRKGTLELPTKLRTKFDYHPIPELVPAEFIKNMGYNITEFREEERKLAVLQDSYNRARIGDNDFAQA